MAFREIAVRSVIRRVQHGSIAQVIDQRIVECAKGELRPEAYFQLTELVNPTAAFWERTRPGIPHPIEVLQRLKQGQRLHDTARYWFSRLPEFVATETTYDGYYTGVPGVVGRIDYQLGDSILEFKTKHAAQVELRDVTRLYPQDLEQLLFYSAIMPSRPMTNHLVFMCLGAPGGPRFDAFTIDTNDLEMVKNELRARIGELRNRLKSGDAGGLGSCRYYKEGCKFLSSKVCSCASAAAIDTSGLVDNVEIREDKKLAKRVLDVYREGAIAKEEFDVWDVLLPRRWYHKHFGYAEDEDLAVLSGSDPQKYARQALVNSAINNSELAVSRTEKRSLRSKFHRISGPWRFLKLNVPSKRKEGQIVVPYIPKVWNHRRIPREHELGELAIAELALQCIRSSIPTGVLVANFPQVGNRTMCYALTFNLQPVQRALRGALDRMDEARTKGEPRGLEKCPDFVLGTCPTLACSCRGQGGGPWGLGSLKGHGRPPP